MNPTTQLINYLNVFNTKENIRILRQKIETEIENKIKLNEFKRGITYTKEQKKEARIKLAEWIFSQAKNLFDPVLSSVITEYIEDCKDQKSTIFGAGGQSSNFKK